MSMKPMRAVLALALGLAGVVVATPAANAIDEGSSVNLAIAVPIVVGPGSTGLLSSEELEAYTRPLGDLTRQLDAVIDRPVAIAIDPMIIASIRLLGTSAPETATAWLARLASATNETFALGYADTDLTLATQAGSTRVLEPESFDFAIDPALFAPATDETATPTPEPTTTPDEIPALPTSESLVQWPYTFESVGWPRTDTVTAADLPALSAYDSLILSSSNIASTSSSVVDLGGTPALVSDAAVSSAFSSAATAIDVTAWAAAVGALDESLSAAARVQSGTATVFATLSRGSLASGTMLTETLDQLASTPGVTLVSMSDVASTPPTAATIVDMPQDGARVQVVHTLLEARAAEQQFSSVVEDPQRLTAPRQLQALALTSNSWVDNQGGWSAATSDFLTESRDILDSVQIVESTCCNLVGDSGNMPIGVTNSLGQAVTVYITVRPETALISVGNDRVELVVEPNSQGKGEVPVEAISNGTVEVVVSLSSATGVQVGNATTAEINVQAGWETPIAVVLAALVIGVFGFGIVRRILRRRRENDEVEATDD